MGLNTSFSLFSITFLLLFSTIVTAENITRAFEKYSNFSTMSHLFTETQLTDLISKYRTITLLALDAEYVTTLYHNPFNLSIIQISRPIVAPGLSFAVYPSPPPPAPLAPAPAPSPMDAAMAPTPAPAPAPGQPDSDNDTNTLVPITTPATETPEADSPAPAPSDDNEKVEAADKAGPSSSACKPYRYH